MKITISRLLYYTTLVCVVLALLRFLGFDSDCVPALFWIFDIAQSPGRTPEHITKATPQELITAMFGMACMIVATVCIGVGLITFHLHMLELTAVKQERKEKDESPYQQ